MTDPTTKMGDIANTHGLVQNYGIAHCNAVWRLRCNWNVRQIFARLWGTNDLLSSFDGISYMLPSYYDRGNNWAHVDQSIGRLGLECIQGYVSCTDASDLRTGSLAIIPGSHKKMKALGKAFPSRTRDSADWVKFTNEEMESMGYSDASLVRVHSKKGDLVCWRSDAIHQSKPPPKNVVRRPRVAVFTSYQPRKLIDRQRLEKKRDAFAKFRMTSHWAASRFKLFPQKPREYGGVKRGKMNEPRNDRVDSPAVTELAGVAPLNTQTLWKKQPLLNFVNNK
jgi:hypothetical protein